MNHELGICLKLWIELRKNYPQILCPSFTDKKQKHTHPPPWKNLTWYGVEVAPVSSTNLKQVLLSKSSIASRIDFFASESKR